MTYKQVYQMLLEVGIPVAYNHFDTPQELPFICYVYDDDNDLMADNINYQKIRSVSIELYTQNKDFDLEATVEAVLTANELPFSRSEDYLDSERMYMVIFDTQIVIKEEN